MLLFNRYDYNPHTDLIGKGAGSKVYKVLDKKLNRWLALKMYKATEETDRYSSVLEIEKVTALKHPNICAYLDIDSIEKEDSFGETEIIQVCVMEIAEGGNIDRYFEAHPDFGILRKLLIDVLHGLQYLHEKGTIHRDIKPANILVINTSDGPVAVISDFGIIRQPDVFNHSTSSGLVVSVPYMAPEQLNAQKYGINAKIGPNVDLWALGIAVYEIITGDILFKLHERDSAEQIMNNIVSGELPSKVNQLPQPFREFVRQCLVKDAAKRPGSPEELLVFLEADKTDPSSAPQTTNKKDVAEKNALAGENQIEDEQMTSLVIAGPRHEMIKMTGHESSNLDDTQIFIPPTVKEPPAFSEPENEGINESDTTVLPRSIIEEKLAASESHVLQVLNEETPTGNIDDTSFVFIPAEIRDTNIFEESVNIHEELEEPLMSEGKLNENIPSDPEPEIPAVDNDDLPANNASPEIIVTLSNEEELTTIIDEQIPVKEPESSAEKSIIVEENTETENEEQQIISTISISIESKPAEESPLQFSERPLSPTLNDAELSPTPTVATRPKEKPVVMFNRYEYYPSTHLIGKGGFSRVYKAFDKKLSRWIALKIYKTGEFNDRYSPIAEIQRVINLDHPNICRYLDIDEIEKENQFGEYEKIQVCVMELLESGNFLEYYKKTNDLDILKKLLQDVLNGISYLHKNGIIHRDIKPANILIKTGIDGPVAKITDFGISKKSDSDNNSSSALVVSIPYMAPEQLNVKKYGVNEKISFNLDLWSLGVTIYEVITGKVLFKNSDQDNSEQIMTNIMLPELPEKINELPQPFRSIVSHCVIKNANERAQKAEELLVLLNTSRHSDGFKDNEVVDHPHVQTPIASVKIAEKKSDQETTFIEKKIVPQTDQTNISETKKRRKNFLADDDVAKAQPQRVATKSFPVKTVVGIVAVLIILLVSLIFFRSNKGNETHPTELNTTVIPNSEPHKPTENSIPAVVPKNDSASTDHKSVVATDQKSEKDETREKVTMIPEKKKDSKANEDISKTAHSEITDRSENSNKKYSVNFEFSQSCILKINNVDYGENVGGIKIPLVSGTYSISAISTKNKSLIFTKTIVVNAKNSGQRVYVNF